MSSDDKTRIGNLLSDDNFEAVAVFAAQHVLNPKEALNQIVEEWSEYKLTEGQDCNFKADRLDRIEEKLNEIIISLDNAFNEVEF